MMLNIICKIAAIFLLGSFLFEIACDLDMATKKCCSTKFGYKVLKALGETISFFLLIGSAICLLLILGTVVFIFI